MTLKYKSETIFTVDYNDLEDFINDHYGLQGGRKGFCYQAVEEIGNDTQKRFRVCKEELDDWDVEKLNTLKEKGHADYCTRIVLVDLCNKDLIEPGTYLIEMSY